MSKHLNRPVIARVAVAALTAVHCGMPLRAEAQRSTISIHVSSCLVVAFGHGPQSSTLAGTIVEFEKDGDRALRQIVWRANTPAGTLDLVDAGRFSPRVRIRRSLEQRGAEFRGVPGSCVCIVDGRPSTLLHFRALAQARLQNYAVPA